MMGAAFLVDVQEEHGERVLGEFLFSAVMLVFAVTAMVLLHMVYRRLRPTGGYGVFLCHHKGGAAVLGRYFKIKMGRVSSAKVFLDSDQLEDLSGTCCPRGVPVVRWTGLVSAPLLVLDNPTLCSLDSRTVVIS